MFKIKYSSCRSGSRERYMIYLILQRMSQPINAKRILLRTRDQTASVVGPARRLPVEVEEKQKGDVRRVRVSFCFSLS